MPRPRSLLRRAIIGLILLGVFALGGAWLLHVSIDAAEENTSAPADGRAAVSRVKTWGYQLQGLDVAAAARSPLDLLVIDQAIDGLAEGEDLKAALAQLKRKPDGGRRLVLAYLSIGEAEDYRPYWQDGWVRSAAAAPTGLGRLAEMTVLGLTTRAQARPGRGTPEAARPLHVATAAAPAWLGGENATWRGNYRVRYWHPDWQSLVFGSPEASLDRILAAGFDGVYLDRAATYSAWEREHATARDDMVRLIGQVADYARERDPRFVVVLQNAEQLLEAPRLRRALDAVAKEGLLYGEAATGAANPPAEVSSSLRYLTLARRDGLPVLVVEYLSEAGSIAAARDRLISEGFVPTFGPRAASAPGKG